MKVLLPRRFCVFILLWLTAGALRGQSGPAPLVPIGDFFADSAVHDVQLAPDGKHLAYLTPFKGRVSIALIDLTTGQTELLARAADENIRFFLWKGPDHIVYGGDVGGDEAYVLLAINLQTRRVKRLSESYRQGNGDRLPDARSSLSRGASPN
jgi:hypothetical protein